MRPTKVIAGFLFLYTGLLAQDQPAQPAPTAAPHAPAGSQSLQQRCGLKKLDQCFKDVVHDQVGMWTSPLRLKPHDAIWLVPFAGATGAAFAYDEDALRQVGTSNRGLIDKSEIVSRFGSAYAAFGEAGVLYFVGAATHNDHLRETGVLGAEAVINSTLITGGIKLVTNRERPDEGVGTGRFWPRGPGDYNLGSSFPSGHSAASWALARVIAAEYPGWQVKLGAYGFATAISASRITGRRHFPSDVVVGSTLGYLIGDYVVRHHASRGQQEMSLAVLPVMGDAPGGRGIVFSFTPSRKQMEMTGHMFERVTSLVKGF